MGEVGLKVYLSSPGELPNLENKPLISSINQKVLFYVKPKMTVTLEKLKKKDFDERRCYFDGEKKLKFFKLYTKHHCNLECISNLTLKALNCVHFTMVRDNETKVCDISNAEDIDELKLVYYVHKAQNAEQLTTDAGFLSIRNLKIDDFECNCLPNCRRIDYEIEMSQYVTDIKDRKVMPSQWGEEIIENSQIITDDIVHTSFSIQISGNDFAIYERREVYGWEDFLASCGGILGNNDIIILKIKIFNIFFSSRTFCWSFNVILYRTFILFK